MAKVNRNSLKGVPASNNGNRVQPKLASKIKNAPNFHTTYGVGDSSNGGTSVPAMNNGNRVHPKLAGQIKMATNFDSYNPPVD